MLLLIVGNLKLKLIHDTASICNLPYSHLEVVSRKLCKSKISQDIFSCYKDLKITRTKGIVLPSGCCDSLLTIT